MKECKDISTVSFIIPTYNRLNYLKIALESCLKQSVLPQKIIIGDDSTNDETENWFKDFRPIQTVEIQYIRNRPSLKQAKNVEMLIQEVDTEFLLLLHDDDYLFFNALQDLLKAKCCNPEVDVVFGKQYLVDKNGVINQNGSIHLNNSYSRTPLFQNIKLDPMHVALNQQLPSNSFLLKTALAKDVHYYIDGKGGDAVDFMFCLNLAKGNANFMFLDTFISAYRQSPNSVSTNGTASYDAFKLAEELDVSDIVNQSLRKNFLRTKAAGAIMGALKKKNKKEAWRIYFSKYHRNNILSLGGMRRGLNLFL